MYVYGHWNSESSKSGISSYIVFTILMIHVCNTDLNATPKIIGHLFFDTSIIQFFILVTVVQPLDYWMYHSLIKGGGCSRPMVLSNLQYRVLIWIITGQGPTLLAVGRGGVGWHLFSRLSFLFFLCLSLLSQTAVTPKTTKQQSQPRKS